MQEAIIFVCFSLAFVKSYVTSDVSNGATAALLPQILLLAGNSR
jgi:hypothetical protein